MPRPRQLLEPSDVQAEEGRLSRRGVRREAGADAQPERIDPACVGDDCDLRLQRVAEEVDGRDDARVRLQRRAFSDDRAGCVERHARMDLKRRRFGLRRSARRSGGTREHERAGNHSERDLHATAPRHIWRRSAQRRKDPSRSP